MKRITFVFIIIELLIIVSIICVIIIKFSSRSESVSYIKKESITFPQSKLRYFYEPKPGLDRDTEKAPLKATYTINKDTLHETRDYAIKKANRTYRIITLGDSFTYGLYVDTKNNWTEVLETRLNRLKCGDYDNVEVINLGVHGYDTRYTVERYIKRGAKYAPDLVIWLFVDLTRIDEELIPLSQKIENTLKSKEDYYFPWRKAKELINNAIGANEILKYQQKSLRMFEESYKGPLIAIPVWRIEKGGAGNKLLTEFAESRKDTYLMRSLQSPPKHDWLFTEDAHPNVKGHDRIAQKIQEYLLSSKLLPCYGNGN